MNQLYKIAHLVRKDMTMHLQNKETAILIFLFSLLVVLVFSFAFGPIFPQDLVERGKLAGSVLWASFAFAGVIAMSRSFAQEQEHGALQGILLTGIDPANLYLAKVISNTLFLIVLEAMLAPITLVLMGVMDMLGIMDMFQLLGVIALGTLGFSAVGTILAGMANAGMGRESFLSVLLFPMIFPVVIGASRSTIALLTYRELERRGISNQGIMDSNWLLLLIVYSLVFLAVSYLLFEYVIEQ